MTGVRRAVPFILFGLAGLPTGVAAQEISGVAQDATGAPIADAPVALHRVGGGAGGMTVATRTTDADGGFRFSIEAVDSAVYFVAMRHDDRLYIGPPARGGIERVTDYVIRADAGSEAGAVASALSGSPAGMGGAPGAMSQAPPGRTGGTGAVWFVGILALVVATIFVTTAPAYRSRRKREMAMELARIENRIAGAGPDADTEAEARRRAALRERLVPRG